MSARTLSLTDDLYDYILSVSLRESSVLRELRAYNAEDDATRRMQTAPEQAQFLALLVKMTGARRCLEIGVLTGYSSIAVAQAMPADGRITACDISEEWTRTARAFWKQAGVDEKIDLLLGPAAESLHMLIERGESGSFDFAFIDADKTNYDVYYEACLKLLRPGGVIAIDNVLWGGSVIDPKDDSEDTRAIRELNTKILTDERVDISLVPIGDGVTLARKKDL